MIPIIIEGTKYKIKSIAELNTSELIELSKLEAVDTIKYIAWQTGCSFENSFFAVTDNAIEKSIGKAPDITKMKLPKVKYVDFSKTLTTVGQRHQVEGSGLSGYELLVFVLAVSQARSLNIDDVYKLRDIYLKKSWQEILPAGFFFYKIYKAGSAPGLKGLLKRLVSTLTLILNKGRGSKG